jgi:Fur family ferric uptake transcriptional regulator
VETQELRDVGLKVTLPRMKILEIMEREKFEAAGLVTRHHFEGGNSVFELNKGQHHDHIVCAKCGKVDEFTDDIIEERQNMIARKLGYELTDHSLYLYGLCPNCK